MGDILPECEKCAAQRWQETEPVKTCANCAVPVIEQCVLHITIGDFALKIAFCRECYWHLHKTLEGW